jgi:histidinol-phosphate aminotransferase
MAHTTAKISPFKAHIDNFQADLNKKAGRTTAEVQDLVKGKKLYKLSSNENVLGPSPKALEAIRNVLENLHEYAYRTDDPFREALSAHFDGEIAPDQFITANSGLEIIDMLARGFLEPGLECIYSNPTFHVYEIFAQLNGASLVDIPLLEGNFELDVDGILNAITDKTRLVFVTNPNNPTGTMIPKAKLDRLIDNLPAHVILVHDEVYWHFADQSDFPFAKDYVLQGKNVVGLHSFSKAYGLAGMRAGYAFSTPRIATYLQKLRRPFFINAMSTEGAIAALGDVEHVAATQALMKAEKPFLYAAFEELNIKYWESHTNFILFKSPIPVDDLVAKMLAEGVMIRSGANNGAPGHIRVTVGTHEGNVAFVEGLKKILG